MTVSSTAATSETAGSDWVDFVGTYSPEVIYETDAEKHNLYLGAGNTLHYPTAADFQVNAFRAYFRLKNGLTAGEPSSPQQAPVRSFNLNFGDDSEASGIVEVKADADLKSASRESGISNTLQREWYTLDGRRLSGKPTQSGIYISGGKKVCVK